MNVLLLEHDRLARSTLEVVLAQRGHDVTVFQNQLEALDALRRDHFPLLIVGVQRGTNGELGLVQNLRHLTSERNSLIMAVIPAEDTNHIGARLASQVHHILTRPIDAIALRKQLDTIEQQASAASSSEYALSRPVASVRELEAVADHGPDLAMILDRGQRVRYAAASSTRAIGRAPAALLNQPFIDFLHARDQAAFEELFTRLNAPGARASADLRLLREDGGWTTVEARVVNLLHDLDVNGYILTAWDARERRSAERELARVQDQLAHFVDDSPFAVIEIDSRLTVSGWSGQAEALFGWPATSLVGRQFFRLDFLSAEGRRDLRQLIERQIRAPSRRFTLVAECAVRGGGRIPIEWHCSVTVSEDGRFNGVLMLGHRIDAQLAIEDGLRRNERRQQALAEYAGDATAILDDDGRIRYVTPGIEGLFGHVPDWWQGRSVRDAIHEDDCDDLIHHIQHISEAAPGTASETFECRVRHADGSWRLVEAMVTNRSDSDLIDGNVLTVRLVPEARLDTETLRHSERRFRSLVQHSTDLLVVLDAAGHVTYVSPAAARLIGEPEENQPAIWGFARVHPNDQERASGIFQEVLRRPGDVLAAEFRVQSAGGRWHYLEANARNLLDDPSVRGIVVNAHDVTERKQAEAALRLSEKRFRSLVQYSSDLIAIIGDAGTIKYASPSVRRVLGYAPEDLAHASLKDYVHPDDHQALHRKLRTQIRERGASIRAELRLRHTDGNWKQFEAICTNLIGEPGINGIVVNARDITDRKLLERRLSRRAFLDPLTDLPNRALFLHRLAKALDHARAENTQVAVLFLDLDRFKVINDSLGHEVGDHLLIAVARRLRQVIRPGDTVARFGGDELIILLNNLEEQSIAIDVARRIIDEVGQPFQLERNEVAVSTSIGIAFSNGEDVSANDLIRNADIALYRAKESGSGHYVVFDTSMARRAVERLQIETELRRAIQNDEFRLEFLPELDLNTGRLISLEVLIRWNHPHHGPVHADEFMEVADETGLIVPIGRWALEEACAQISAWQRNFSKSHDLTFAINLSAREFQQPDIVDFVTTTIQHHGLQPDSIRLEVAEAVMAAEPTGSLNKLRRLRERGLLLAIDDFGTGNSALSYLTQVTFDVLKIDRQFVSGPGGVTGNLSIVRAMASLAHALGMKVTAEGIETREHLARARAAGCDYGQGYLFSHAIESHAVEALLFGRKDE